MIGSPDLWDVRALAGELILVMQIGDAPALELAQGKNRVRVELGSVKTAVTALVNMADLVEVLASGGV